MTSFTNTFGGSAIQPTDVAYRAFAITTDTQLYWPAFSDGSSDVASRFMDITSSSGTSVIMPDATLASNGQDNIINNIGSNTLTVKSYGGATIASVAAGTQWYIINTSNSTSAGVWRAIQFGAVVSQAQAASLAGLGLNAIGSLLNLNFGVTSNPTDFSVTVANRATVFVWTGGSGSAVLPDAASVGSGFAVGFANNGTGSLTVSTTGGQLIDGAATSVYVQTQSGFAVSDGVGWYSVGKGQVSSYSTTLLNKNVAGSANVTLTNAEAQNTIQQYAGLLTGNINVIVPTTVALYYVYNGTTGAHTLNVKTAAGTGVAVAQAGRSILYCDGTNVVSAFSYVPSGSQTFPVGSAATPSVSFQSNSDTGLYVPSTGMLGASATGYEVMRWTAQASSVNSLEVDATATGFGPIISAIGNDTDINVHLTPKGAGTCILGKLDNTSIGSIVAAAGAFTTLSASSTVSGVGFSTYLASPPAIGGTAPAGGAFTTLAASGTVSGAGFSTYLASPPAIGGTAQNTINGTTITATSQFSGPGTGLTGTAAGLSIGGTAAGSAMTALGLYSLIMATQTTGSTVTAGTAISASYLVPSLSAGGGYFATGDAITGTWRALQNTPSIYLGIWQRVT